MTERTFDGLKIGSKADDRYIACGRRTYVWPDGLCDGCSYFNDPTLREWVRRKLDEVADQVAGQVA